MGVPEAYQLPAQDNKCLSGIARSFIFIFLLILLSLPQPAVANWRPLTERLVADGFSEQRLALLFSRPEVKFEPATMADKISVLVRRHQEKPAVSGPLDHNSVHKSFLKYRVITKARSYLQENRKILKEASTGYCVPPEVIVSILLVETRLGHNTGRSIVFNRLASMASCTELETIKPHLRLALSSADEEYARTMCRQKADWAYKELKALLNYAGDRDVDPLGIRGSIYGAIGLCQFMPSNLTAFGIDADKDGRIDPFSTSDAVYSIANYLNKHGWSCNISKDGKRKAVFAYNNSTVYVNTVLAVADRIGVGRRSGK